MCHALHAPAIVGFDNFAFQRGALVSDDPITFFDVFLKNRGKCTSGVLRCSAQSVCMPNFDWRSGSDSNRTLCWSCGRGCCGIVASSGWRVIAGTIWRRFRCGCSSGRLLCRRGFGLLGGIGGLLACRLKYHQSDCEPNRRKKTIFFVNHANLILVT